jgi:hypothetical protein
MQGKGKMAAKFSAKMGSQQHPAVNSPFFEPPTPFGIIAGTHSKCNHKME